MNLRYSAIGRIAILWALLLPSLSTLAAEGPHPKIEVAIADLQFKPAVLTIHVGDTVVWTNQDNRDHTVIDDGGAFASGNIKAGQIFAFTFAKPGKYSYGCRYHPRMKAVVVVQG